jgi:hypothetical protein
MIAVISLMVVLTMSMIVVRIGAAALKLTGLSEESARFQALSAFTGAGFTTSESEQVVGHPVRRRIISLLLRFGSAGIISAIATLILSFTGIGGQREGLTRLALFLAGLLVLLLVSRSRWVDRRMSRIISWALSRWTALEPHDYEELLRLSSGYSIREVHVDPEHWLVNRALSELELHQEGIAVIGIARSDGSFVGSPKGRTKIQEGDVLILYGLEEGFNEFEERTRPLQNDPQEPMQNAEPAS